LKFFTKKKYFANFEMPTPERNLPKSDSLSANVGSIAGEPVNT